MIGHPIRGRHLDRCQGTTCTGCLPALAAAGLVVCTPHELDIRRHLRDLPGLWAELGDTRRPPSTGGRGGGDPEACPDCDEGRPCSRRHRTGHEALSPARIAARHAIRTMLAAWCRILQEDLSVDLPTAPPDTIRWMGHWVARHAGRVLADVDLALALHLDLQGWASEDGTRTLGVVDAWRLVDVTRPAGVRVQCPSCGAWVRLHDDEEIIRCPGVTEDGEPCPEWGTIEHWRKLVAPDTDRPMTAPELVDWLATHHRYQATVETIWQWASRGTRYGKLTRVEGDDGIIRYDPIRAGEIVLMIRGRGA